MVSALRAWAVVGVVLSGSALACTNKGPPGTKAEASREAVVYECHDRSALQPEPSAYRFEVDGESVEPWLISVTGRPGTHRAGDVARVHNLPMVLGDPGHYRYFVEDEGRRVMLSVDDGPRRLVALRVESPDALVALTDEERAGLRGVRLSSASFDWDAALSRLALEHVVVAYDGSMDRGIIGHGEFGGHDGLDGHGEFAGADEVPRMLPAGLRYLELKLADADPFAVDDPERGKSARARLSGLRYLDIELPRGSDEREPADLRWIAGLGALEYLRLGIWGRRVDHLDALGGLDRLRVLDISSLHELSELGFVSSLGQLRHLDVHGTEVESLAPLSGHLSLEVVEALDSPVAVLPAIAPPRLREMTLMSTGLSASAVEAFAAQVPEARILHRWNQALAHTTACADRIRVRTGGLCHRERERERTLFEVTDAAEVERVLPMLYVDEPESMGMCMCCGEPTIEFYRGDRLVTAVGFHHGKSLRWRQWPADGMLSDATALCGWMEGHGAAGVCDP